MGSLATECGAPDDAGSYDDQRTAYIYMKWISVGSTFLTGVVLLSLKGVHLFNYRYPREQRQVMRIFLAPSIMAIISMWEVLDYRVAQYIDPIANFYETIFLCAIFFLATEQFLQFVAPGGRFGEEMFQLVHASDETGQAITFDWPRITWIFIFQCPVFGLLVLLITDVTESTNTFCSGSLSPKYGNFWATVITTFSLGAAIGVLWKFYQRIKKRVKARHGLSKIVCFKAMVGIRWFQALLFGILIDHKVLKPNKTFSYADLLFGLPNTINCVEMVVFAFLFWRVCDPREYLTKDPSAPPKKSFFLAFLDSFNMWDILAGIGRIFTVSMYLKRTGGFKAWMEARQAAKKQPSKKSSYNNSTRYEPVGSTTDLIAPSDGVSLYPHSVNDYNSDFDSRAGEESFPMYPSNAYRYQNGQPNVENTPF